MHSMPQFAPASGASTSSRINARASWARRSTGFSLACVANSEWMRTTRGDTTPGHTTLRLRPPRLRLVAVGGGCRLFSVRQLAVAVQQLHRREEEQPKADQRGQDAQRKHGGPAMVDATAG